MIAEAPPKWFNAHGHKMVVRFDQLETVPSGTPFVTMGTNVARLQIRPDGKDYRVHWFIAHVDGRVEGRTLISEEQAALAFGLSNEPDERSTAGHFVRRGRYLNVPTRGTGLDGDPNISIYVTDEIRYAIRDLLAH